MFKVNPPLRTGADVAALRAALADGVIDIVATDHAPHAAQDKECEWDYARPGMLGLETALSVVLEPWCEPGLLDWRGVARVMSERAGPDRRAGRPRPADRGRRAGQPDPGRPGRAAGRFDAAELARLSANTPYAGMELPGRVVATFLRGRPTVAGRRARVPAGAEVAHGHDCWLTARCWSRSAC